jgi:DNA helicase IV
MKRVFVRPLFFGIMSLKDSIKKQLYEVARNHAAQTVGKLEEAIKFSLNQSNVLSERKSTSDAVGDKLMLDKMFKLQSIMHQEHAEEYKFLQKEPYFSRCDVMLEGTNKIKSFYFAKFPFLSNEIYSWVAPAARVRFEDIGEFNFETVKGNMLKGRLLRKDQYMIVDGKIIFMASEATDYERSMIHQEYLSTRKQAGFAMQDIVSMMEKAQDKVIRADHKGSFLISGPAGSGKTTLALHRVAYLTQSPETAPLYPGKSIIVFVQDKSTKDYFSALLPNLGINDVVITTFPEWACTILKLDANKFVGRLGESEEEKDIYEFEKRQTLAAFDETKINKNYFRTLELAYENFLSKSSKDLFKKQKSDEVFDRFDLTLLIKANLNSEKILNEEYIDYIPAGRGKLRRKIVKEPLNYSLIIIDETQNYLPEQIALIKTTIDPKTNSMLYVGDLVQQTHLGTIRDWNEADEDFKEEQKAELSKVYRNTKQILEFIQSLGYKVSLGENLRDGVEVKEAILTDLTEEADYIKKVIQENPEDVIGILVRTVEQKKALEDLIESNDKVRLMTINESQGVEFDIVILAGIEERIFIPQNNIYEYSEGLLSEKKKVNKDLLYVALTRAINELHVIGRDELNGILEKL